MKSTNKNIIMLTVLAFLPYGIYLCYPNSVPMGVILLCLFFTLIILVLFYKQFTTNIKNTHTTKDIDSLDAKLGELKQIIDLVPGFIYSKDLDGNILLVNEALSKFLNTKPEYIVGKNEEELKSLGCLVNKDIENEILLSYGADIVSAQECEVEVIGDDNISKKEINTYLVFRAPLFNKSEQKIGILVFAYDITMLKNIQQNLEVLNYSLEAKVKEELDKNIVKDKELMLAKEKFVRNAVHELNSALTIITLNAEYLMEEYGKSKPTSVILGAAKSLSNSYDDLSYATVKSSPLFQEEKDIDFSSLLLDRIRFFEDIAELNDIVIKSEIEQNMHVKMNMTKLIRVIDNNLSNAIKYSYPKNTTLVKCFCDGKNILLEFESVGKKIEDKNKIFELYGREDGAKRGHGVGLSMVKEICDESKIDIEVVCDENKNTFRYRFSNAC